MGSLFNRLGELLTAKDEPEVETPDGPSAIDAALQEAIKKRARKGAPDDATDQPRVTITPEKNRAVFGRRGA